MYESSKSYYSILFNVALLAFVVFELIHIHSATQDQVFREIAYFTVLIWAQSRWHFR